MLKAYQPGGLSERAATLQALTGTAEAESPKQAVEQLRLWKRQLLRTQELGASSPDPTLLIHALHATMRKVLRLDSQAAFRVSVYRMQQQVDVKPSHEGVCRFHEILLAEAELLAGGQSRTLDEPMKTQANSGQGCEPVQMVGLRRWMSGRQELQLCAWAPGGSGWAMLGLQFYQAPEAGMPLSRSRRAGRTRPGGSGWRKG